jgi:hypothetical protein
MTGKKGFILFFILFLITAFLNFIARKKMGFSYADLPGYNQLYEFREQLRITKITSDDRGYVSIAFMGNGIKELNEFTVYSNNDLLTAVKSRKLTFKPLAGANKYFIKINNVPGSVTVDLNYTPESKYKNSGNSGKQVFEVTGSNIPVEPGHLYSIDDWALTFDNFNSDIENKEAAHYLNDSMNIKAADRSAERIVKIAHFILQRVKGMSGIPTDSMATLTPVNQLKCVQAGKSKLWCGNYTAIFGYFARKAGLAVRLVSTGDNRASMSSGTHMFLEVLLKENNRWAYVDLLAKTIFVKKGDQFLNVIDVSRLLKYSVNDTDFVADYFDGDSIVQKPFNQVAAVARYYFHENNSFTFYFSDYFRRNIPKNLFERVNKIFYTKPYYALYGDNIGIGKAGFIFRIITTYLMFLFLALCLFLGLRSIRQKGPKQKTPPYHK